MRKEGVLDNPAVTVNTFKFLNHGQSGQNGLTGGIRAILDEQEMLAYFVANEGDSATDGRIMTQRLNSDELVEFRQTGTLRLMCSKSDEWDEGAMWDKGDEWPVMAISDKAYMIGVYLREECDYPSYRDEWVKLLDAYNSGKAILSDIAQQMISLSLVPENSDI